MELGALLFFSALGVLLLVRLSFAIADLGFLRLFLHRDRKGLPSEDTDGVRRSQAAWEQEYVDYGPPDMRRRLARRWYATPATVRLWMQVAVSIITLTAALLLIFLRNDAEEQKWAYGTIGLIIGFWLK
jgi:hypothetical protein